jgi:lysophospholipase L1-like esterase
MKVKEKLLLDKAELEKYGPVNIVIFGDSVSHGAMRGYFDYENVYWNVLKKKLNQFRSYVPVNMINVSIGGTTAAASVGRLESQALNHSPDMIIVCFGLNDVGGPLEVYLGALKTIFAKSLAANCEVVFMTPNMLNTRVAEDTNEKLREYAAKKAEDQNSGRMDTFIYSAIELADSMGVTVCDCYSKWKELSKTEDVTMLLANRINHPTPEMHKLFADSLYETIIGEEISQKPNDSAMYNGK